MIGEDVTVEECAGGPDRGSRAEQGLRFRYQEPDIPPDAKIAGHTRSIGVTFPLLEC